MLGQNMTPLEINDILKARERLAEAVPPTPLLSMEPLNLQLGGAVYLKAESLQPSGAYKFRGAYNKCAVLAERFGTDISVITASSGNHGLACALTAKRLGIRARVVVPVPTPRIKKDCIREMGAELVEYGETYDSSFREACRLSEEAGAYYVHPVSDTEVLGAQGTIGLEILEQLPSVRQIVIPLGGGGLSSGIAYYVKHCRPDVRITCVMPEGSAVYAASRKAGKLVELASCASMADAVVRKTGEPFLFPYIEQYVDEIVTVRESSIRTAVKWSAVYAKLVLEGAGALPLAAVLERKIDISQAAVLVCSGGNIDLQVLWEALAEG